MRSMISSLKCALHNLPGFVVSTDLSDSYLAISLVHSFELRNCSAVVCPSPQDRDKGSLTHNPAYKSHF